MNEKLGRVFGKDLLLSYRFLLFVLVIIGFLLRFINLDNYPFWIDEIISIQAAEGVINNGVPVMPGGDIYYKSLLHIYPLAAFIKAFGISAWSTRFLSSVYGTLTIILVYIVTKKFSGNNKMLAFSAAIIFTYSLWAVAWAREARFYQQFQFFTLLTIYLFWLAYIEPLIGARKNSSNGEDVNYSPRLVMLAILAFILTIFSSKLTIILVVPLGLSIIYLKGFRYLFKKPVILSFASMIGIWAIVQVLPIILSFITKNPVMEADKVGLDPGVIWQNILSFGFFVGSNIIMFILITLGMFLKPFKEKPENLFLTFNIYIISLIMVTFITVSNLRSRYFFFIYPIMIITATISAYHVARFLQTKLKSRLQVINTEEQDTEDPKTPSSKNKKNRSKNIALDLKIFIIFILLILTVDAKFFLVPNLINDPYSSIEFGMEQTPVHPDYDGSFKHIQDNYREGDVILVKWVRIPDFYLNTYLEKDDAAIKEYTALSFIDLNLSNTRSLFDEHRVWILFDTFKDLLVPEFISEPVFNYLESNTTMVYKSIDGYTRVWLENA